MSLLKRLGRWLADYWFPVLLTALVLGTAVGAIVVGLAVPVPDPVPEFALQAHPVYRAQVGGAWFIIYYLMIMAIALAFSGRGFIRFGPRGIGPGKLFKATKARRKTSKSIKDLQTVSRRAWLSIKVIKVALGDLSMKVKDLLQQQGAQEERIEQLEKTVAELDRQNQHLRNEVSTLHERIDSARP